MADFDTIINQHADEEGNIPTTAIKAIVTAIKQAVGNEFVDKERYKGKLTELDDMKKRLQTAEDDATTASTWETKYNELQKEFDDYKAEQTAKELKASKEKAFRELLTDMNVSEKGIEKILKWQGVDDLELSEDGKINDVKAVRKSVKEDWGEYIQEQEKKGAETETPPDNSGGKVKMTLAEIDAIEDPKARREAMLENLDLYNI